MSDNVRTLDFNAANGGPAQVMPEDVFEGDGFDASLGEPVPQFTEEASLDDTVVVGDFGPQAAPLAAASLHQSQPFIFIEIPGLGVEMPLEVETATALFDALGAAINAL